MTLELAERLTISRAEIGRTLQILSESQHDPAFKAKWDKQLRECAEEIDRRLLAWAIEQAVGQVGA